MKKETLKKFGLTIFYTLKSISFLITWFIPVYYALLGIIFSENLKKPNELKKCIDAIINSPAEINSLVFVAVITFYVCFKIIRIPAIFENGYVFNYLPKIISFFLACIITYFIGKTVIYTTTPIFYFVVVLIHPVLCFLTDKVEPPQTIFTPHKTMQPSGSQQVVLSDEEKDIIFKHEAGHILISLLKNFKIEQICLAPYDQPNSLGYIRLANYQFVEEKDILALVCVTYGGICSERFFTNNEYYYSSGCETDVKQITHLLKDHYSKSGILTNFIPYLVKDKDRDLERLCAEKAKGCYEETMQLVRENSDLLKDIVGFLYKFENQKVPDEAWQQFLKEKEITN
ncbi:hypothetical protein M2146_001138 [Lachnospiraceae bacterium PF1-22]